MSSSTKQVAKIPLSKISKIRIYVNSNRKTLSVIKKETGADYIINGGLFNGDWTPCPLLKVDGKNGFQRTLLHIGKLLTK